MDLTHTFVVPASVDETWAAFMDLESIAPCFPGATLTSVDGDDFAGAVKVKLGPIALLYNGTGRFVERDEANHRAVIEAKGKDKRGNGTAGATVVAQLTPDGTGTSVEVTTDLAVTGKPAQFGRGVIQDISDKLLGQFVECIAGKLDSATPPPAPEDLTTPVAADAGGEKPASTEPTGSTTTHSPPPPPSPGRPSARPDEPIELNLGRTVLPVLLKRYGIPAAIVIVVIIVIWLIAH